MDFQKISSSMLKNAVGMTGLTTEHKFKALFGVSPYVCSILWEEMIIHGTDMTPFYLLWGLLFLKTYGIEHVNSTIVNTNPRKFRNYAWQVVHEISSLSIVCILPHFITFWYENSKFRN